MKSWQKKKNTKKLNKIKDYVNNNSEKRYQKERNKKKLDNLTFEERLRYKDSPAKYRNTQQYDLPSTSSADTYLAYTKKISKLKNNKAPTFVGPIPASWKRNANTSRFKVDISQTDEVISLKNLCIKKIASSLENNEIIEHFGDLPLHLKELIMNKIPIYGAQITNEMLVNLFLESNFNHLHLVHSVVTFPVLSAILKIRYINKHHTTSTNSIASSAYTSVVSSPTTSIATASPSTNIYNNKSNISRSEEGGLLELSINNNDNEEGEVTPPDSWEDIYNSSDDNDNYQIHVNKKKNKQPMNGENRSYVRKDGKNKYKENEYEEGEDDDEEEEDEEEEEEEEEEENENLKEEIKQLEKKFKKHITLTHLSTQRTIENFKGFKNLVSLDISYCSFLSPKMIPLIQILGDYVPHLKYLNLSGTLIERNGHTVLFMISRLLPHLNFLILNDLQWLENEDLMSLSWSHYFKHLIQLQLKLCSSINSKTLTNFFNLHRPTLLIEY